MQPPSCRFSRISACAAAQAQSPNQKIADGMDVRLIEDPNAEDVDRYGRLLRDAELAEKDKPTGKMETDIGLVQI